MCKRLGRLRDFKDSIIASLLYNIENLLFYFFKINILLLLVLYDLI